MVAPPAIIFTEFLQMVKICNLYCYNCNNYNNNTDCQSCNLYYYNCNNYNNNVILL